jgi:SAM-dependent methyltransferase
LDKGYFAKYYNYERKHWWFKVRAKIIRDVLKKYCDSGKSYNILNVGVATGHTSELLSEFGKVTSVEYDKECCSFLSKALSIEAINASIIDLPFESNAFDLVCAFDVIEHVEDDNAGVREMFRVSKSDGIVFVTVPAFMSLWSYHDEINHHKRRYTKKNLIKLFQNYRGNTFCTYFSCILFMPVFLFRKLLNTLKKEDNTKTVSDFDRFTGKKSDLFFYYIFSIERILLKLFKLPFGSSILLFFKKHNNL